MFTTAIIAVPVRKTGFIIWQSAAIEGSTFLPLESKIDFLTRDPGELWKCPGSTDTKATLCWIKPSAHYSYVRCIGVQNSAQYIENFSFTCAQLESNLTLELDLLINIKNT